MLRRSGKLLLVSSLVALSGCGDNSNSLPQDASTAEYAKQTHDKMIGMYGAPKSEKKKSNNASDMMNSMYNRK